MGSYGAYWPFTPQKPLTLQEQKKRMWQLAQQKRKEKTT